MKGDEKMPKRDTAPPAQRGVATVRLPVNTVDDISFQIGELSSLIARHAYDCFEARGGQHGDDLGDWLRAEEELVYRAPFHSQEQEDRIELGVDLPQSARQDLQLSVEPRRLLIRSALDTADHDPDEPSSAHQHTRILFHVIDLLFEIDVENVTATMNEGNLRVTFPKQMGRSAPTPNPDGPRKEEPNSAEGATAYLETAG